MFSLFLKSTFSIPQGTILSDPSFDAFVGIQNKVGPGDQILTVANDPHSIAVAIDDNPATFPPEFLVAVALGALGALVWWRKRKTETRKKSFRRLIHELEREWKRYCLSQERVAAR